MRITKEERHRHLWAETVAQVATHEGWSLEESLTKYSAGRESVPTFHGEVSIGIGEGDPVRVTVSLDPNEVALHKLQHTAGGGILKARLDLENSYRISDFAPAATLRDNEDNFPLKGVGNAPKTASEILGTIESKDARLGE